MNGMREGRVFVRDTLAYRPSDAARVLTEIPGIISAILGEDGKYVVRFDPARITEDEVLATMDREGLEVVAWDDLEGDSDTEARADTVAGNASSAVASSAGEGSAMTVSVLLRGGPLDGESRPIQSEALLIDEPLTIVQRDAGEEAEAPGVVGVMEYLYRGDGVADYVGGLPADEQTGR